MVQVDLAEEPGRRSGMLANSGGKSTLPQLHVNGKVRLQTFVSFAGDTSVFRSA